MSRIFILGATGSLGRHVVRQATEAGHSVTALVRARVGLALPLGMEGREPPAPRRYRPANE